MLIAGMNDVTWILKQIDAGDPSAAEHLLPLVYDELRKLAAARLAHEAPGQTLQATALVHEAYLRLVGQQRVAWQNRAQFFGLAAQMMRRILVDHARALRTTKRPAPAMKVALAERIGQVEPVDCDLLLLDQALSELAALDPQQSQIVELRYFGGLAEHEVAEVLAVSRSTVTREWQTARAWLYRRMTSGSVKET
jgi:RNA polymerase sigma factor (TIGR02999 family)